MICARVVGEAYADEIVLTPYLVRDVRSFSEQVIGIRGLKCTNSRQDSHSSRARDSGKRSF